MSYEFTGYHGTNSLRVSSIKKENFNPSQREDEWLGHGVYFFIDGIGSPIDDAEEWAKNQAYVDRFTLAYKEYSVILASIKCSNVFDVTSQSGLRAFNKLRTEIIIKYNKSFLPNRKIHESDCIIWNLICQLAPQIEAITHNVYIKTKTQRIKKIHSIVPNATIICVKSKKSIQLDSINVVKTGTIELS